EDGPLGDLTFRLYRFSAGLGVIAFLTGGWLGWQWDFPTWVWVKLSLVALLIAHYTWTGVLVARARRGRFDESDRWLRVFNEVSVVGVIAILYVVVAKPF
ncbi:MAG: CopD family protein, partial [Pseudomonadota bacterium]